MTVIDLLSAHPCFKAFDPDSCRVLDRHCTWLKAAGAWIVGRTANDRNVHFVMAGRRPALHGVRRELISSDIEAGSFFGELSAVGVDIRHTSGNHRRAR